MKIDWSQRRVRSSVGRVAAFEPFPRLGEAAGHPAWRLEEGREWHQRLRREDEETNSRIRHELAVQGSFVHRDWTFALEGRIDQWTDQAEKPPLIREIKTTRNPLPFPAEHLRALNPSHFYQAALYQRMIGASEAEVLYVEVDSGFQQAVPLGDEDHRALDDHLNLLVDYLERGAAPAREPVHSILESPRPYQKETFDRLSAALATGDHSCILFEAPTGFGKTALVLEAGTHLMREGSIDRVLFLTARNSGQETAMVEWARIFGGCGSGLAWKILSRERCCFYCTAPLCATEGCQSGAAEGPSGIWSLVDRIGLNQSQVTREAEKAGLCQYQVHHGLLPLNKLWTGDYNYLFSPTSHLRLSEQLFFDPQRTLLVVDEAHQLRERVSDALSLRLGRKQLESLRSETGHLRPLRQLHRAARNLEHFVGDLSADHLLSIPETYDLQDLVDTLAKVVEQQASKLPSLSGEAMELIWRLPSWSEALNALDRGDPSMLWCPRPGEVRLTCLDPSDWIRRQIQPFHRCVLMSATLRPFSDIIRTCGLQDSVVDSIEVPEAAVGGKVHLAVDPSVDTRWKRRADYYGQTALTAIDLFLSRPDAPLVVFFSSRRYALEVATQVENLNSSLKVCIQGSDPQHQVEESSLQKSMRNADLIFLFLGGRFAESVNALGGQVHTAMVVGPGLPEVNMERRMVMEQGRSFEQTYLIPGLRKVRQAVGRLVRSPEHCVRILLHCQRFSEAEYRRCLPPSWRELRVLAEETDLKQWMASTAPQVKGGEGA